MDERQISLLQQILDELRAIRELAEQRSLTLDGAITSVGVGEPGA